jgi:DNA-binding NtrC family response regulator
LTRDLTAAHIETLCTVGSTEGNVRELIKIAETLAARVALENEEPRLALSHLLADRFPDNPVVRRSKKAPNKRARHRSHYEKNKSVIISTYRGEGGNISATERKLKSRGIKASRRWLNIYLQRWGER